MVDVDDEVAARGGQVLRRLGIGDREVVQTDLTAGELAGLPENVRPPSPRPSYRGEQVRDLKRDGRAVRRRQRQLRYLELELELELVRRHLREIELWIDSVQAGDTRPNTHLPPPVGRWLYERSIHSKRVELPAQRLRHVVPAGIRDQLLAEGFPDPQQLLADHARVRDRAVYRADPKHRRVPVGQYATPDECPGFDPNGPHRLMLAPDDGYDGPDAG